MRPTENVRDDQKKSDQEDCPIESSEECVAVNDDNVSTTPIMADKEILEFIESSKNIIDANSDDENEMNNATPLFPPHPKYRTSGKE
ncbi:hypothetical protein TNCV_830641 [Trichonephila clavipes]|nr:hypothetical protein TNCV_830641 [Trichonephila clavipes]